MRKIAVIHLKQGKISSKVMAFKTLLNRKPPYDSIHLDFNKVRTIDMGELKDLLSLTQNGKALGVNIWFAKLRPSILRLLKTISDFDESVIWPYNPTAKRAGRLVKD